MKISICIPTAELQRDGLPVGVDMLSCLLESIRQQTYKNYEVIISDHSISNIIENECKNWPDIDIKYFKYNSGYGSATRNLNNAISKASGEVVKTILQDDYFYSNKALEDIANNINEFKWGAMGTYHCNEDNTNKIIKPHLPKWIDPVNLLGGANSISGPSVLFFINDHNYFDENLCWLNDVELYYRLFLKYGNPILIDRYNVMQRLRKSGLSNTISPSIKKEEKEFVFAKHNIINKSKLIKDYPSMYNRLKNIK